MTSFELVTVIAVAGCLFGFFFAADWIHKQIAMRNAIREARAAMTMMQRRRTDHKRRKTDTRWRHIVRGSTYVVIEEAHVQASTHPLKDNDVVVVYRSEEDGVLYVRHMDEFHDGRFARLAEHA